MIINYVSAFAESATILMERLAYPTSKQMQDAKKIKYTKMEDAFALKDFSSLEMFAMFAHPILLTIYLGLDANVPKDTSL